MQTKFITGLARALQTASGPVEIFSGSAVAAGGGVCVCVTDGVGAGGVATGARVGSITGGATVSFLRGTAV